MSDHLFDRIQSLLDQNYNLQRKVYKLTFSRNLILEFAKGIEEKRFEPRHVDWAELKRLIEEDNE